MSNLGEHNIIQSTELEQNLAGCLPGHVALPLTRADAGQS